MADVDDFLKLVGDGVLGVDARVSAGDRSNAVCASQMLLVTRGRRQRQREPSGDAGAPLPSTWAMMALGFGALGRAG
jgi:hypothetical protein